MSIWPVSTPVSICPHTKKHTLLLTENDKTVEYRLSRSVGSVAGLRVVDGAKKRKDWWTTAGRILMKLAVVVWDLDFYQLHRTRRGTGVNHLIRDQLSCTAIVKARGE